MAKAREFVQFKVQVPTVDLEGTVRYFVEDLKINDFNIKLLSSSRSSSAGIRRIFRVTCDIPGRKLKETLEVFHDRTFHVSPRR